MGIATERALLGRGWTTERAAWANTQRLTISRLVQSTNQELEALGLTADEIETIRKGARPPIPLNNVIKVLHDSKRTCCVCRDPKKPVVIHHMKEWSKSHDHSESNLVVLCLEHHDQAHTKKQLSLALTPQQLQGHKASWLATVRNHDAKAVLGLAQIDGARWDYINHNRLFELGRNASLQLQTMPYYKELVSYGILHESGMLVPYTRWSDARPKFWLYNVGEGMFLYAYMESVLKRVIAQLPLIDVTNLWTREQIRALVKPGCWIALQSAFYFKRLSESDNGQNQERRARRRSSGIEIEFHFDAWEATSCSSKAYLSGYQTSLAVLFVKSINVGANGAIKILGSVLAIGSSFEDERKIVNKRPPPSYLKRWAFDEDDEECDFDLDEL